MSLSKTEVMGEYQSYMGKGALLPDPRAGDRIAGELAVTLSSASLNIKEVLCCHHGQVSSRLL